MLWFKSWHPSGPGATVGVCIALFFLAVLDRYMHALWRACNAHWARGRVWFAAPVARGALQSYEDDGQVVVTTGTAPAAPLTQRAAEATRSGPPSFTNVAARDEKVIEKPDCCGGGVPDACNCGCGGECGQSSSPAYAEQDQAPDASRGLDKPSNSPRHLPAAVVGSLDPARVGRWSRPFRWNADLPRGIMWAFITALHYALMLVVMTYQIWWIISVIVGAGIGEMLFGRYGATR